jgi:hypothetical protein
MSMKNIFNMFILLSILLYISSCRQNRLKTNEKKLANEILLQEKTISESEKAAKEKESESKDSFSGNLRKKEIRSVDPQRPPVLIDIPGTRNNIRKFKLSDIASSVRYIKLQTPPDTMLLYDHFFYRSELMSIIRSDGEQIIFQGLFGLTRFNMQGEYLETIWKNENGIEMGIRGTGIAVNAFYGIMPNTPVSLSEGNMYFSFTDGPAKKGQVFKYKPGSNRNLSVESSGEIPEPGKIPGDVVFNTNLSFQNRFDATIGIGSDKWAGINQKWNSGKSGSSLVTFNDRGDTLCKFTDYERIVNFSYPNYRRPVDMASYTYHGLLTIKQEYNDTVFRLIGPNRLLPVYNINFGEFKVNYMDGLNPDLDLSGKYMLNSLRETSDFLMIRYTQNNDSPNNLRKNAVKFYNVLFDKKEGKIYHYPGFTLIPEGLINDFDGGVPFWPDFITPQGEMMKLISGKVIKDFVNSSEFKNSAVSGEKRQKLISMASGLKPTDMIIMIVK